jgi:S1-C subfamily serine protease
VLSAIICPALSGTQAALTHINAPRLIVRMLTSWYLRESTMKRLVVVGALAILITSSCAQAPKAPSGSGQSLTESSAIQMYLEGRDLSPIEGIWNWSDGMYQIVITRNDSIADQSYEFVGIITRADRGGWKPGQIKLLIDETAVPTVYTGTYYAGNQSAVGTSFIFTPPNLIETSPPVGSYGAPIKVLMIRSYPNVQTKQQIAESPPNQGQSSGTCFFIDAFGTAVTNSHVIEGQSNIEIVVTNGTKSSATVIKTSRSLDVAVLATGHQTSNFLTLAPNDSLTLGLDVFTIGYPVTNILGDKPKYSEGTISALSGLNNDDSWIQVSTPIQPGNSGGPLVNEKGQVVGIVTATAAVEKFFAVTGSLPQNINWAIKAEYARALIPANSSQVKFDNKQDAISHTEKSICRVIAN